MNLEGKHVLVTGAGKRLGRAIASRLLDYPIRLTVHYRKSRKEAASLVAEAERRGREATLVRADLKSTAEIRRAATQAVSRLGPIDVLVNSASAFYPTPVLDCSVPQWDDLLDANLKGQFFFAQHAARTMMRNEGGVIVNLADVYGEKGLARYGPYAASKGGLLALTKSLARELAPKVRVNAISPGPVLFPESYTEEQKARSIDKTLLKREGSPADIAEACLFLVQNDYITGFNLVVDGGRSLG